MSDEEPKRMSLEDWAMKKLGEPMTEEYLQKNSASWIAIAIGIHGPLRPSHHPLGG